MLIGGLQKTTLIDYPGKVAATIFTIGCNFRCSFCYNSDIVRGIAKLIPVSDVFDFLKERRNIIDAVCITGGEPTLQTDLYSFIKKIKELGFLVKLDTNGAKPDVLQKLLDNKLIDYIAMDIKAPWNKYDRITARKIDVKKVRNCAKIIRGSGIDHEFRSTVLPALHSPADIVKMAEQIRGAKKYYLQPFQPGGKLINVELSKEISYSVKQLKEIIRGFEGWFETCAIR